MEEEKGIIKVDYSQAVITADFDAMREKLEKKLEPYHGVTLEAMMQVEAKEAKALRAELNAWKKDLDEARKAIKREYSRPLAEFEEKVKQLVAMIDEPCAVIDAAVKKQEQLWKDERAARLDAAYEEFCALNGVDALVESVPFDKVCDRTWLNKTTSEKKALAELETKVSAILAGWNTIKKAQLHFPEETERIYFDTLSVEAALNHDAEQHERQERIDALKNERDAVREYREPVPELVFEEITPKLYYEGWLECTKYQMDHLVATLKAMGVHGSFKCKGEAEHE